MQYYLRKEPYECVDDTLRVWTTEDRALYKHKSLSRYYRDSYPIPTNNVKLFTTTSLKSIVNHQMRLYEYSGERFDIYTIDENNNHSKLIESTMINLPLPTPYATDYLKLTCDLWTNESGSAFSTQPQVCGFDRKFKKGTIFKCVGLNRWCGTFDRSKDNTIIIVVNSTNRVLGTYSKDILSDGFGGIFEDTYDF